MEIVNVDWIFDGFEAEFVGGTVNVAAFDSAAGHPHGEAVVVVVATVDFALVGAGFWHFDDWGTSEFAAPDDKGVF